MSAVAAYIDTVSSGLIACQVIGADQDNGYLRLTVRVTGKRTGPYDKGQVLHACSTHFIVPRSAVIKFRSSPFPKILPYSWREELAAAHIAVEGGAPCG